MKVTLDLDALVAGGYLDRGEAERLAGLGIQDRRGGLMVGVLLILGALAVSASAIALVPNALTGLILAIVALGAADLSRRRSDDTAIRTLSNGLALAGTLGVCGWIGWEFGELASPMLPALIITGLLTAAALYFRLALLAAFAVLSLGAVIGSGTSYWHASYGLYVREPTLTILFFGVIAAGLHMAGPRLGAAWQRLATAASRTAFFMMNFGFWVGSLFGDRIGRYVLAPKDDMAGRAEGTHLLEVPETAFILGWPLVLIALIALTRRGGFLSTTAIVFLAIHGYTQFFETFQAELWALLIGGLTLIGVAMMIAKFAGHAPDRAAT